MERDQRVLDFGSGAGRLGVWLTDYLDVGNYTGVDHHWAALDAFSRYEIPLHRLAGKSPRLILDGSLEIARINSRLDLVLDCYVSFHLSEADRMKLYHGFSESLNVEGRIFLPHAPTLTLEQLDGLGLVLVQQQVVKYSLLVGQLPAAKAQDHWHVIQKK